MYDVLLSVSVGDRWILIYYDHLSGSSYAIF